MKPYNVSCSLTQATRFVEKLGTKERYWGPSSTNIGRWGQRSANYPISYRVELSGFRRARPQSTRFPFRYGGW